MTRGNKFAVSTLADGRYKAAMKVRRAAPLLGPRARGAARPRARPGGEPGVGPPPSGRGPGAAPQAHSRRAPPAPKPPSQNAPPGPDQAVPTGPGPPRRAGDARVRGERLPRAGGGLGPPGLRGRVAHGRRGPLVSPPSRARRPPFAQRLPSVRAACCRGKRDRMRRDCRGPPRDAGVCGPSTRGLAIAAAPSWNDARLPSPQRHRPGSCTPASSAARSTTTACSPLCTTERSGTTTEPQQRVCTLRRRRRRRGRAAPGCAAPSRAGSRAEAA